MDDKSRISTYTDHAGKPEDTEQAIRESELNFRTFFETMDDMLGVATLDGVLFYGNSALMHKLGYDMAELKGKHLLDLLPAADLADGKVALKAFIRGELHSYQPLLETKEGLFIPVEFRIWRGKWNGEESLFCVGKDLTAVQEAQHRFQQLFRYNPALMALNSVPEMRFVDVNDVFLDKLGYTRDEVVGKTSAELGLLVESGGQRRARLELDKYGRFTDLELQVRNKQGELLEGLFSGEVIHEKTQDYYLTVMVDITDLKRVEKKLRTANEHLEKTTAWANALATQAEIASSAKSDFLANMSHELRTPISGVIGMTNLLLDTPLNEEQQHYTEIIRSSGGTLLALVNDILDFSKIEAGKLDLEEIDFDLDSLLDDITAALAAGASEKRIEFACVRNTDVPVLLRGDPVRIRQVLTNLVDNAIKFTAQGEVSIQVGVDSRSVPSLMDTSTIRLRFCVRDSGIGIPADKVNLLFEKFTQVDASTTRKYGGSGLGLAICKRLVELMDGEIGVNSLVGKGSEFWFTMPLVRQQTRESNEAVFPDLQNLRVLVVDDHEDSRGSLMAHFTSWQVRAEEAADGEQALHILKQAAAQGEPHDLVIIDQQMPGMDGEELGQRIMASRELREMPLLMLLTPDALGESQRLIEAGYVACLPKPAPSRLLLNALRAISNKNQEIPVPLDETEAAEEMVSAFNSDIKKHILLVEDNKINQQVASGLLRKMGLRADIAGDGFEAAEMLENNRYDLILMDLQIPGISGLQLTHRIRGHELPEVNSDIPIIAMTAHVLQVDRDECQQAGMNDFISKPISFQTLKSVLQYHLFPGEGISEPVAPVLDVLGSTSAVVFDRKAFLERILGDEELAVVVLKGFVEDIPKQISLLRKQLEQEDRSSACQQIHTIKGAAANIGAESFRQFAEMMETTICKGSIQTAQETVSQLQSCFLELRSKLLCFWEESDME